MLAKKRFITAAIVFFTLCVLAAPALAARDIGEIAQGLTTQADYVGIMFAAVAAVIGIVVIIWGCLQLKNAGNRGDATVGKGLTAIAVGVCLVCLVALAASGSKTVFGDESSMADRVSSF